VGQRVRDPNPGIIRDAFQYAAEEAKNGRSGVIVFPNSNWMPYTAEWKCMPPGWYLRFASLRSKMLSIRVDTAVVVGCLDVDQLQLTAMMIGISAEPKWVDFPAELPV